MPKTVLPPDAHQLIDAIAIGQMLVELWQQDPQGLARLLIGIATVRDCDVATVVSALGCERGAIDAQVR